MSFLGRRKRKSTRCKPMDWLGWALLIASYFLAGWTGVGIAFFMLCYGGIGVIVNARRAGVDMSRVGGKR